MSSRKPQTTTTTNSDNNYMLSLFFADAASSPKGINKASILCHPTQTQSRHAADTCTACTLYPSRQSCVGSKHLSKDSWSQLLHDGHGQPQSPPPPHNSNCPIRHTTNEGNCHRLSPQATCAYYGLNLNQESREALHVTKHNFIGLHFVLQTAINNA